MNATSTLALLADKREALPRLRSAARQGPWGEASIPSEVLARQPALAIRGFDDVIEQLDDRVMRNEPLAVLGKDAGNPDRIVHGQANEPAIQEVVLGLLHELALRANAEEDLQEHRAQQLLRCDAGTPALDVGLVHAGEQAVHLEQRFVDHRADRAQRVIRGHEVLQAAHSEQALGEGIGSAHRLGSCLQLSGDQLPTLVRHRAPTGEKYFNSLLTLDQLAQVVSLGAASHRSQRFEPLLNGGIQSNGDGHGGISQGNAL